MKKWLIAAFISVLFCCKISYAQVNYSGPVTKNTLRVGVNYKGWRFGNVDHLSHYSQLNLPVSLMYHYDERLSFFVLGSLYRSTLSTNFVDGSFVNISDLNARASCILGENAAIMTVGVGLPTGKSKFNSAEYEHTGFAANHPLDYPITLFGSGFNANASIAYAKEFNNWIIGAGAGYYLRTAYQIDSLGTEVKPGNEYNLALGIDRNFEFRSRKAQFTADFVYTNYLWDYLNERAIYEAGDKFVIQTRVLIANNLFNPIIWFTRSRFRLDDTDRNSALIDNGNEYETGLLFYQTLRDGYQLKYLLNTAYYNNTTDGADRAIIAELGVGMMMKLSSTQAIDPTIKLLFGKLDTNDKSHINLAGIVLSASIMFAY